MLKSLSEFPIVMDDDEPSILHVVPPEATYRVPIPCGQLEIRPVIADFDPETSKIGFWSINAPKLAVSNVGWLEKTLRALKAKGPLTTAYIDSPEVIGRFNFSKRDRYARANLSPRAKMSGWFHGGCSAWESNRWEKSLEKTVALVVEDGDALIREDLPTDIPLNDVEFEAGIKELRSKLVRFVCSGLHIWTKQARYARNGLLMNYNRNDDEQRARGLLREMIGDEEFRQYLRRGFIVVKGKSGMRYVVRGGYSTIACYTQDPDGKYRVKERLCLQFDHEMAHTDGVIMRKLYIENDEFYLRKISGGGRIRHIQQEAVAG